MIRHAVAVAVVLAVSPAWVYAQNAELTVNTSPALVYKGPSIGSPVIGRASRGTVLEVVRELGDWVKVTWPSVPEGIGYVRVSVGTLARNTVGRPIQPGAVQPTGRATPESALAPSAAVNSAPADVASQPPPSGGISRVMGFGGRMGGSTLGFGGSFRGWSRKRIGMQFEVSRYSMTIAGGPDNVTTLEVAPSLVYSLRDHIGDYVWLRPYVGGGANVQHATQTGLESANKLGFQTFGGGEFTFANAPQFAVSTDLGYRFGDAPYEGFDLGRLRFSLSGHWYLK
jgi:hypothetical protein